MKSILILLLLILQNAPIELVKANVDVKSDTYEKTLNGYKASEMWGDWSMQIGDPISSPSKSNNYSVKNLVDYDLNTAWVPKYTNGIGDYFGFKFHFPSNTAYAGAYQFYGVCNLFNGYCKSLNIWRENSRVKTLEVYYNNHFICKVQLLDTWHFQSFDISKYFVNKRDKKYLDAKYEIKEGDELKFKITEVYPGSKYNDVAVSGFYCEGGAN